MTCGENFTWTKGLFLAAKQCPKRLYLQLNEPHLKTALTASEKARIETGTKLGTFAQLLFPLGLNLQQYEQTLEDAARKTQEAIEECNCVLFEASFIGVIGQKTCFARTDILEFGDDGWDLTEVKSSTKVKDEQLDDLAFQLLVMESCGYTISRIKLCLVNNTAVRGIVQLQPQELFRFEDVTTEVRKAISPLKEALGELELPKVCPGILVGPQCNSPVKCPFYDHCHKDLPQDSILNLPGIRKDAIIRFQESGVHLIHQIPNTAKLNAEQKKAVNVVRFSKPYVSSDLKILLEKITFPAHFIDFEAAQSALPMYEGLRPYQAFPFQWSSHVLRSLAGEPEHYEFLHELPTDPRIDFVSSLRSHLESAASVVYYSPYEVTSIRVLVQEDIIGAEPILEKLSNCGHDLLKILRNSVYFEDFRGSFSIKKVLPAMVKTLSYAHLEIQDGDAAMFEYMRMISNGTNEHEKKKIATALRAYCKLDTLAMVELFKELHRMAR